MPVTNFSKFKKTYTEIKNLSLSGHSIGGLVAKSLFLDPNFDPLTINIIITLATPHSAPVLNADKSLNQFYEDIDNHWNYHRQ